jgi:hypothetical protein
MFPPIVGGFAAVNTETENPEVRTDVSDLEDLFDAALAEAAAGGLGIVTIDRNYEIDRNVDIDPVMGRIRIRGDGNLHVLETADGPFNFIAAWPDALSISAFSTTTHTFPGAETASTAVKITTTTPHACEIGDLVKVLSDDVIPGDPSSGHKVGEFAYVADIGTTSEVWIAGKLRDTYTTTPRLQRVPREPDIGWDGPTFTSPADASPWACTYLQVRGFIQPDIKTGFTDCYGVGVAIMSCFQAEVEAEGREFLNRVSSLGVAGYLVQDSVSEQSRVKVRSLDARHAYTTTGISTTAAGPTWKYGRTWGSQCTGAAKAGSSAEFDFHSNAADCTLYDAACTGTRFGEDASGAAAGIRGLRNVVRGFIARNTMHGAQFNASAAGDCIDCRVEDMLYDGAGDGVRVNESSPTDREAVTRPVVARGLFKTTAARVMALWECTNGLIDGATLRPAGSGTGDCGIVIAGGTSVIVRNLVIDLTDDAGSAFDAFQLAEDGCTLIVESARVINANSNFRSWLNGTSKTGTVDLFGLVSNQAPTSAVVLNGGSLTALRTAADSAAPTSGAWLRGDRVWNSTPSAAGVPGWVCVTAGTPGTWKAMAVLAS